MILTASAIALAALLVANVVRVRRRRRAKKTPILPARRVPSEVEDAPKPQPVEELRQAFGLGLGDVVLLRTGEEAWLSGVLVLDEGAQTLALFVGPDSGGSRYVLAERSSSDDEPVLTWLTEAPELIVSEGVHVLEHAGERLQRERRRPLAVKRTGSLAPDLGASAVVLEYQGEIGGAVVMLKGERRTLVLAGRKLHPGTYEILPGSEGSEPDA